MARLRKKMDEAGVDHKFWTLHDLKKKGVSDAEDKKIGGHKTEKMRERYDVKIHAYAPPR
jgi:hypothetical protein